MRRSADEEAELQALVEGEQISEPDEVSAKETAVR
jgi:hypothetical protein